MKMHPKRKLFRTVVSIIDIFSIGTLWFIALISLAVAMWQQITK